MDNTFIQIKKYIFISFTYLCVPLCDMKNFFYIFIYFKLLYKVSLAQVSKISIITTEKYKGEL